MLANWVSKAANLLQDDAAAEPGTTVGIDLPAHWRSVYWALATWSVGATVVLGESATGADVLVTDSPERAAAHGGDTVLVTLAALARANPRAGEAPAPSTRPVSCRPTATLFSPMADPSAPTSRWRRKPATRHTAISSSRSPSWGASPRVALRGTTEQVLRQCLSAWAADGSVVIGRGASPRDAERLASESRDRRRPRLTGPSAVQFSVGPAQCRRLA